MSQEMAETLGAWDWAPDIAASLAVAIALYAVGWWRVPRQLRSNLAPWRAWSFGGGLALIAIALLSPIDNLSESLFFMHMIQHILLLVSAPLLLLGAPLLPMRWALPGSIRRWLERFFADGQRPRRVFDFATHPIPAAILYLAAIGIWHNPAFYDAALANPELHELEHLIYLGTSFLFWWCIAYPLGEGRRMGSWATVVYLLAPMLEGMAIGAALTFSSEPLYSSYVETPPAWGISPLQDQQLAGLLMWVPMSLLYNVPILILLVEAVQREERLTRAREEAEAQGATEARR